MIFINIKIPVKRIIIQFLLLLQMGLATELAGKVTGTYYRFLYEKEKAHAIKQIKNPFISGFKIEYVSKQRSYSLEFNVSSVFLDDLIVVHT